MEASLSKLADLVSEASDEESLVRPILELLEEITSLESTYLTMIDSKNGVQKILYSRNSRSLNIPEGLSVPWNDTLCKRALDEETFYTDDVPELWGDSKAARQLGIRTYLSRPVHTQDGTLYGTLCAASKNQIHLTPDTVKIVGLLSLIIAQQLDRDKALKQLQQTHAQLAQRASKDPLTGLANRATLIEHISKLLKQVERRGECVAVAFIDLDGFKAINDRMGHRQGDRFLIEIADHLTAGTRGGDLVARYGGDEFIVVSVSCQPEAFRKRLEELTSGQFLDGENSFYYAGPSIGIVVSNGAEPDAATLLAKADEAMYEIKRRRKAKATASPVRDGNQE